MVSSESTFFVSRNTCVVFIFTQPLYMLLDIGEGLTPGYISILQSYHASKYEPKPVESLLPIRILYREQRNPRMSCQKTICTSREYAMCLHSIQVHFAQTPRICNLRQDWGESFRPSVTSLPTHPRLRPRDRKKSVSARTNYSLPLCQTVVC